MKGILATITFGNILKLIVTLAVLSFVIQFLITDQNNISSVIQDSVRYSFSNVSLALGGSGAAAPGAASDSFCNLQFRACKEGDSINRIPSCSRRNRCEYLDRAGERTCNQNCARVCAELLRNCRR